MSSKLIVRLPRVARSLLVAVALGSGMSACLPADTRPTPGTLVVNVTSDESLSPERTPVQTDDGWSITFDRFLLAIGNTNLKEEDACIDYQGFGSGYGRLLDLKAKKSQRLSEMRFLGNCSFSFEVAEPRQIDVLGENVSEADRLAMRYPVDDAFTTGRGVAVHAIGSARKGDQTKHFDWEFRQGLIYEDCQAEGESAIELSSEESETLDIVVSGSVLFKRAVDDRALRFDAFAEADDVHGDGDGNVTLDEMAEIMVDPTDALGQGGAGMVPGEEIHSLADLVYRALVPQVARYRGDGTCHLGQAFHAEEPGEGRRGD